MCTCVSVSMSVYVSCVSLDFDEDSIKRNPARDFLFFLWLQSENSADERRKEKKRQEEEEMEQEVVVR